jgi:hypothetical protein
MRAFFFGMVSQLYLHKYEVNKMGWQRKQYDKNQGKFRRVFSGSKDWTREQKQQIEEYQKNHETRDDPRDERRKAG